MLYLPIMMLDQLLRLPKIQSRARQRTAQHKHNRQEEVRATLIKR